jgi:hypothetical protein
VAAIVAIASLIWGLITFLSTSAAQTKAAEAQTQASAIGLIQEYHAVALQNSDVSVRYDLSNDKYFGWFASFGLTTAESIYDMTEGEAGEWRPTVSDIVRDHIGFVLTRGLYPCERYTPEFVRFTQNLVNETVAAGVADELVKEVNPRGMVVVIHTDICEE